TFFRWFPIARRCGPQNGHARPCLAEVVGGEMIDVGEAEGHGVRAHCRTSSIETQRSPSR
ncbi:MAG TPA: hypothetical protein VFP43_26430, partial [Mesorhizobium sp.]|nr:hypothetical protein [Mesorhizobium sp.]